jgi:hypothetical protein
MRYGSCDSQTPTLLTGGVVAGPQGCPLVAPSRLADTSSSLHLRARARAVALPPITAGADDHQPGAPRAVEHPVALLDGRAPATEDWTRRPPPAILTLSVVLSLRRWHRSPGSLVNPLQAWASSSRWRLRSTAPIEGRSRDRRSRRRLAIRRSARRRLAVGVNEIQTKNHIQGVRLAGTKSSACAGSEPDPIACDQRKGRTRSRALCTNAAEPHPALMREENQTSHATAHTATKLRIHTAADRSHTRSFAWLGTT